MRGMLSLLALRPGIEGFCGSGCQTGFLTENWKSRLAIDTALVLVHANNPHGFAQRRINEDNIDLNRNFIDFDAKTPESPEYAELHPALVRRHGTVQFAERPTLQSRPIRCARACWLFSK